MQRWEFYIVPMSIRFIGFYHYGLRRFLWFWLSMWPWGRKWNLWFYKPNVHLQLQCATTIILNPWFNRFKKIVPIIFSRISRAQYGLLQNALSFHLLVWIWAHFQLMLLTLFCPFAMSLYHWLTTRQHIVLAATSRQNPSHYLLKSPIG